MSERSHSLFDDRRVVALATVSPESNLAVLSQREVNALCRGGNQPLQNLFRRCALAVLSSGAEIDDVRDLFERYRDFDVSLVQAAISNPASSARTSSPLRFPRPARAWRSLRNNTTSGS